MTSKIARATTESTEATKDATQAGADAAKEAQARFGNFVSGNVTESFEKFSKGLEGVAAFQQDNVEAVVRSSEIAAKAFEGIGSEITAFSKRSFEDGVTAAQDFASARTVTELFEKQTAFAQNAFEGWLHQTTKMNEIIAAAAKDITAPLGQRVQAASGAMKSFAL
jgi:phasin family protein